MEYCTLGNTGLKASVAGLGCGGNSRLGQRSGKSETESANLILQALDLGVNLLDTAAVYGTEGIVGKALQQVPRDQVIVSTKSSFQKGGQKLSAEEVIASLDNSLATLGTSYIDIFHLHGVPPAAYDYCLQELAPALLKAKDAGKLRFLGITETSPNDPQQQMLQRATQDGCWEVIMLGFHMMNQKARHRVFPQTLKNGIGTLLMFVVRNIFSQPDYLQKTVQELAAENKVPAWLAEKDNPLDFLLHESGAATITEAAYRFARHEPGADVVLFGTGSPKHLRINIESILKPPLPDSDLKKLNDLFGELEGIGLDLPGPR